MEITTRNRLLDHSEEQTGLIFIKCSDDESERVQKIIGALGLIKKGDFGCVELNNYYYMVKEGRLVISLQYKASPISTLTGAKNQIQKHLDSIVEMIRETFEFLDKPKA